MPDWIEEDFNSYRQASFSVPNIPISVKVVQSNDQWHSWDMKLKPGRYQLARDFCNGQWINWFAVGTVKYPNQPEPIHPNKRFGVITNYAILDTPIIFSVKADQVIRIESWAQPPDKFNSTPLPKGFKHWKTIVWLSNTEALLAGSRWAYREREANFGPDFYSVSRRKKTKNALFFAAEDGNDNDFDDMTVKFTRL